MVPLVRAVKVSLQPTVMLAPPPMPSFTFSLPAALSLRTRATRCR